MENLRVIWKFLISGSFIIISKIRLKSGTTEMLVAHRRRLTACPREDAQLPAWLRHKELLDA
jgi:hypothetical protein